RGLRRNTPRIEPLSVRHTVSKAGTLTDLATEMADVGGSIYTLNLCSAQSIREKTLQSLAQAGEYVEAMDDFEDRLDDLETAVRGSGSAKADDADFWLYEYWMRTKKYAQLTYIAAVSPAMAAMAADVQEATEEQQEA